MNPASNIEQTAAASRAAALERDTTGHFWRNQPLHKWTARREILYLALEQHSLKSTDFVEGIANHLDHLTILEQRIQELITSNASTSNPSPADPSSLIDWHRFLPAAARVLWLAHHEPHDWQHLRADPAAWMLQIEAWGDEHLGDELEAAVRLAHLLRTEHRQFITIPRPEKHHARTDAGN